MRPCLLCRLPADMDTPIIGRLLYWHLNRLARRETRTHAALPL